MRHSLAPVAGLVGWLVGWLVNGWVGRSLYRVVSGRGGFNGSSVHFAGVVGSANATGSTGAGQNVDASTAAERVVPHVPTRAFINLCQHFHGTDTLTAGTRHAIVVRAISSRFRRSPAETFHDECMQPPQGRPAWQRARSTSVAGYHRADEL